MNWVPTIVFAVLGLLTTVALIPILRRRHATSVAASAAPAFHHTHKAPISRLGGVALAAAFVVVAVVGFFWLRTGQTQRPGDAVIVFSSLAMFGLGLWDDL